MARFLKRPVTLILALVLGTLACASTRGVSVGSDTSYPIDVSNQMPHAMTIYWSDGGEPRTLGSVGAGRTERFRIVTTVTSVSITARDAGGTHSRGPYQVSLQDGIARRVIVR